MENVTITAKASGLWFISGNGEVSVARGPDGPWADYGGLTPTGSDFPFGDVTHVRVNGVVEELPQPLKEQALPAPSAKSVAPTATKPSLPVAQSSPK